ncbi:GNAT family acetyltransferase [Fusobacterium sp.]|uniref:GNAT family acetyltransferase n=1 Tax=Fusobacterium sp. TaxID=68766 RepID=UPI0025BCE3DD|nr:GNAT family acetyltransferase [Fusobacterium sp.]
MKEDKNTDNLFEYILNLSTYDFNKLVEGAKTEEEKIFYLKLEELKTQILQDRLIKEGVF